MAWHDYAVDYFRDTYVPKKNLKSQQDAVEWVLKTFRNDKPIKNAEFVFDFRITRFGAILWKLRHEEGWEVDTIGKGRKVKTNIIFFSQ